MCRLPFLCLLVVLAVPVSRSGAEDKKNAYEFGIRAAQLRDKGKFEEALNLAEKAVASDGQDPWYHGLVGALHCDLKHFAVGLKECEEAIRLAGGKDDAWYLHVAGENAYGALDFPLARQYFERVVTCGDKQLGASARVHLADLTEKTLEFAWELKPDKYFQRADGSFLIPIPSRKHPYQTIDKMTVSGAAAFRAEEFEGNDGLSITFKPGQPIRIQFLVTLKPYAYKAELAKYRKDAGIPDETKPYLGKSQWIDPNNRRLQETIMPLRRDNPIETAEAIVAYLRGRLKYDEKAPCPSAEGILDQGRANCLSWSVAFCSLCRAAGTPSRMVEVLMLDRATRRLGLHAFSEFYVPGAGWIPINPQPGGILGDACANYQIRLHHYSINRKWDDDRTLPATMPYQPTCTLFHLGGDLPVYVVRESAPDDKRAGGGN